jgi:hypothetical protein
VPKHFGAQVESFTEYLLLFFFVILSARPCRGAFGRAFAVTFVQVVFLNPTALIDY